jgi:hypothetical protein
MALRLQRQDADSAPAVATAGHTGDGEGPMIVVISDLHFEEEARDAIRNADGEVELSHPRNIPANAYCRLIGALAKSAERASPDSMKLVLAGDIFELYQTA